MTDVDLTTVRATVQAQLDAHHARGGAPLDALTAAWVRLGTAAVATTLNNERTHTYAREALDLGGTPEQLEELVVLVSAIGFHSLHEGGRIAAELLRDRGEPAYTVPLDDHQRALRARLLGDDPYWDRLEDRLPGFIDALLRISPEAFQGFVAFCAIPWRTRALQPVTKELVYLALDATPCHRYLPGLQLHVDNAVRLGATRDQILEVLDLAAAAGSHPGVA